MLKKTLKNFKVRLKNKFSVKIPVDNPILYGELLQGEKAIITGGTSGIGYSIAQAFLRNGATVIITGRCQERIDKVCGSLRNEFPQGTVAGYMLDNCNISNMRNKFSEIIDSWGGNILVNNAGVINKTFFGATKEADFDKVINTDLKGPYFLSEMFAEYLKANKLEGNILNISSSSAVRPASNSYGLAKWGIRGMTLGLAKSLSPYGIVVNAIAPGPTSTSMLISEDDENISRPASPSGRYTTPEEIANLAVILVSKLGRMINGDTLYVTGGCGLLTYDDWN